MKTWEISTIDENNNVKTWIIAASTKDIAMQTFERKYPSLIIFKTVLVKE